MITCFDWRGLRVRVARVALNITKETPLVITQDGMSVVIVCLKAGALGIRPGYTLLAARSLCPTVSIYQEDLVLLRSHLERAWDRLAIESNYIEPDGLDRCYVHVDELSITEWLSVLAYDLSELLDCSIRAGAGRSKWVAFHAMRRCVRPCLEIRYATSVLSTDSAWLYLGQVELSDASLHLSPSLKERFYRAGIVCLGDIVRLTPQRLPKALRSEALRLCELAIGNDSNPVKRMWPLDSCEESMRFESGDACHDTACIHRVLGLLTERISSLLQRRGVFAKSLSLDITDQDGESQSVSGTLKVPMADNSSLLRAAKRLWLRFSLPSPITYICIRACKIESGSASQGTLFDFLGSDSSLSMDVKTGLSEVSMQAGSERARRLRAAATFLTSRRGQRALYVAKDIVSDRPSDAWIHPLGVRMLEPITVSVTALGYPLSYKRSCRYATYPSYVIRVVYERWKEVLELRSTFEGAIDDIVYRVETFPWSISELRQRGDQWFLTGMAD